MIIICLLIDVRTAEYINNRIFFNWNVSYTNIRFNEIYVLKIITYTQYYYDNNNNNKGLGFSGEKNATQNMEYWKMSSHEDWQ